MSIIIEIFFVVFVSRRQCHLVCRDVCEILNFWECLVLQRRYSVLLIDLVQVLISGLNLFLFLHPLWFFSAINCLFRIFITAKSYRESWTTHWHLCESLGYDWLKNLSAEAKEGTQQFTNLLFTTRCFPSWHFLGHLQLLTAITTIDNLNYPEKTVAYYLVNVQCVFSTCWKLCASVSCWRSLYFSL